MFRKLREKINLYLYDSRAIVLSIFSSIHVIVSIAMIGVLIYYYGFPHSEESKAHLINFIEYSFAFYILRYLVKIVYDYNPLVFIRKTWFEASLVILLLVEGISLNVFGQLLIPTIFESVGFEGFADVSNIFIQLFFMLYVVNEIFKNRNFRPWLKVHPGLLFTISILMIMFMGAGLLMLPEMSVIPGGMSFTDALFMSTSSTSVTGLSTVDISTLLTFKGQIVVLFIIKIGGLNTIAFAALYILIAKFGVGLKQHEVIEDFVNKDSLLNTNSMFGKIVLWSTGIEIIGTFLIFILLEPVGMFADTGDRLFHSVFHAVSGFNNAGLTIIPGGLMNPLTADNFLLHGVIMLLFFLGGFGMIYLFDLFEIKRLRERMKMPWKTINFGTKISLYFTLGLIVAGALVFLIFEYNNTLENTNFFGSFVTAIFESLTTRNAGFNTVATEALSLPVTIFFLFLMFVGASSGSAGGGIRTSTFAVICASVVSTIKGKPNTELFKRSINNDVVLKAYSIFVFFVLGNIVGTFALAITEQEALAAGKFTFLDIVFEHVSAASTVGLSRGITADLTVGGKYVLIVAMFIGRVGTLTLAYLFGKEVLSKKYKYPSGHTMVG
ncbi:Trk-type K+ transport system, membrane component [Lishizhenia tianjinensis]|uniref:Trk-type K+ transport system, membrane component n=1 Tax=Lishizhenia tianjinensis TaxID=477690 RepID=A0A1I7AND2_9FLAO|nr:potassium transporter TrkG [Lishizhenia tianjinensis]SFT76458.1 Trk-type K+ transport system, membrane component [Lishizhenia tianjinensis]